MKNLFNRFNARNAALLLVLALALLVIPFSATQVAYAGDAFPDDIVSGANSDDTIYPGSKLLVKLESLNSYFGEDFFSLYNTEKVKVYWKVGEDYKDAGWDGGGAVYSYTVKSEDVGKDIVFYTLVNDSTLDNPTQYNNNSKYYKAVAAPGSGEAESGESGGSGGSESGESGGSGGSSDSGSAGSSIPSGTAPALNDVVLAFDSVSAGEIRMTLINNASDNHAVYGVQVRYGGNIIWDADSHNYSENSYVTVPYGQTVTFEYRVFKAAKYNSTDSDRVYTDWTAASAISSKLAKPKVSVTKISSRKAGVKWNAVAGATGYKVYANNKLIKTLGAGKLKYVYTKAGAGSKKYSVQAVIKNSAMNKAAKGPKSAAKKGKSNSRKYTYSKNPKTKPSFTAKFDVAKITLQGNTYTVTGYVLNNRIYDLQKYKRLDFTIYCDGKKVAHKVFRNLKCSVGAGDYKKMTIRLKGKGGVDFRNADGITFRYNVQPYWKSIGVWTP